MEGSSLQELIDQAFDLNVEEQVLPRDSWVTQIMGRPGLPCQCNLEKRPASGGIQVVSWIYVDHGYTRPHYGSGRHVYSVD